MNGTFATDEEHLGALVCRQQKQASRRRALPGEFQGDRPCAAAQYEE